MLWIQWVSYISVLIALIAMLAKVLRYVRAPQNFRWELYPVPHEKGRAEYGGSYLEELDWWSKPRHSDLINEVKEMLLEILFLKGVYHHNKRVWLFSFPFHFGLYLCIGWLFLLFLGAVFQAAGVTVTKDAGTIARLIYYLTVVSGYSGLVLTGYGALGLFIWRVSDSNQKAYNSFAEYFNLFFFVVVVAVSLIVHLGGDRDFAALRAYVQSLLTLAPARPPTAFLSLEIILMSLLIMYIPLTRMSHFVAKYFLYHAVRWSDTPNERGSKIEKRIMELLQKKVSWNAAHIQTGKSWAEVIKENKNE
ncbi:MAG: nitrate reductase [candidate division Zixibacteria bacterium]|nr:nitrate reductase [candidate division Zixibacteria bacterium]MDD5425346.1 nitrate reductase [candidate division Zixibacteria bacterium]